MSEFIPLKVCLFLIHRGTYVSKTSATKYNLPEVKALQKGLQTLGTSL